MRHLECSSLLMSLQIVTSASRRSKLQGQIRACSRLLKHRHSPHLKRKRQVNRYPEMYLARGLQGKLGTTACTCYLYVVSDGRMNIINGSKLSIQY